MKTAKNIRKLTPDTRSKSWCITINNSKSFDDLNRVVNWEYIVAGREVGKNNTPHLQCFIQYKIRTKFSTVKNQLPRAHIEPMMGTPQQASDYCKKDGDFMEFGEMVDVTSGSSGGKKKAENFRKMIELAKKDRMDEIIDIDPVSYVQHYHAFKRIRQDHPQEIDDLDKIDNIWYYGEPGVGKSYRARKENPNRYLKCFNKWWDGYRGQDVVLLDDFDLKHEYLSQYLKNWCDVYAFGAEMKGTTVLIRPKRIVVTSNYRIEEIWTEPMLQAALVRRFKQIEVFKDWDEAEGEPQVPQNQLEELDYLNLSQNSTVDHESSSEELMCLGESQNVWDVIEIDSD